MPKRRTFNKGMTSRKRKKRADWVYRATVGEAPALHGTYVAQQQFQTVSRNAGGATPAINSQSMILIDSTAFREVLLNTSFADGVGYPAAALPEPLRGKKVIMVEGDMIVRYLGWSLGTRFIWGWRLGWFEQDTLTGLLSLQAEYTMFEPELVGDVPQDIVNFANDRLSNVREKYYEVQNTDTSTHDHTVVHFQTRINRRAPSSKHALALYVELSVDSATNSSLRCWPRLRSLVEL